MLDRDSKCCQRKIRLELEREVGGEGEREVGDLISHIIIKKLIETQFHE
jgi:hypothetical protein